VLRDALWVYAAIAAALGALSFWLVVSRLPGRLGKLLGRWLSAAGLDATTPDPGTPVG